MLPYLIGKKGYYPTGMEGYDNMLGKKGCRYYRTGICQIRKDITGTVFNR
jgi:hypothetical protein